LFEIQNLRTTISGLETHIREVERANGSLIEEIRALSSRLQQTEGSVFEAERLKNVISELELHIQVVEKSNVSLIDEIRSHSINLEQRQLNDAY
jgi:predicted  nucleic acid-binding Zn-ribbon protein